MSSVAIVGGGASGLFCAILCAKANLDVTLFEQNDRCAKKIVASGNGRCNISNKNINIDDYFSQNSSFAKFAISEFGFFEFEQFCNSIGLLLDVKSDGKCYPLSNESKSVSSSLINYAQIVGVKIINSTKIKSIKPLLREYKKVVVATGSMAAPQLGGCDDGYVFAKEVGHNIISPYPMLVGLHLESKIFKKISGVKTEAVLTLYIDGKKSNTTSGDVLFSDYGASGFASLDISCYASKALLLNKDVKLSVEFLPKLDFNTLTNHLTRNYAPQTTLIDRLSSILNSKLSQALISELGLNAHSKVDLKTAKKVAHLLKNFSFKISSTHGYKHAEISGGGVDTREIDPKTYMSKKQKDLYFCGEVLDVAGKRGGYNFAFAWASAYMVAKDITKC